jgi:phospholipid-binding lipoprotein MlaA
MSISFSQSARVAALAFAAAVCGCATLPADRAERTQLLQASAVDTTDPLEPMNQVFLQGNLLLYKGIERPVAGLYKTVIPSVIRDRVSAGIENLEEPRIFINDVLQGRPQSAATTLGRFLLNSTFGIGGLFDWATMSGMPRQSGDFGQTLYVWGVGSGPYIVIPVIGPATIRDGIGKGVDPEINPSLYAIAHFGGIWPTVGIAGFMAIDEAGGLDDVLAGSLDVYPRLRSIYLQKRASELGEAIGVTINPQTEPLKTAPVKPTAAKRKATATPKPAAPNQ